MRNISGIRSIGNIGNIRKISNIHKIRKRLMITGVILIMIFGLTACGNADEVNGEGAFTAEAEDLPGSGEETEKPGNGEDAASGEAGSGKENMTSGETKNGDGLNAEDSNGQNAGVADQNRKNQESSSGRYIPDRDADLYGDIAEIGDMQFAVTEIYVETLDEGGEVMAAYAPETEGESPKITIVYDENTVFEKRKIWNGGADHEDKPATAANLKKDFTAEMWGSYEGDVFHAEAVRIVEVIL